MNCRHCKRPLVDWLECEYGYCDRCLENLEDRSRRRAEWDEFHPGEPCPEVELEP
jgi:hypothetical protein